MTVEEQLGLLRKREPPPTAALAELRQRRLDVTRERLAKVEGIPEARLHVLPEGAAAPSGPPAAAPPSATPPAPAAAAPAAAPAAGGRVEFGITGEGD